MNLFYKFIFILYILFSLYFNYKKRYNELSKGKNELEIFKKYIDNCNNLNIFTTQNKEKKDFPFLSICIPTYNMENYIEKALISIINQSFQDYEIILIDDFSFDNTINIIKNHQIKNNKIKIIEHNKNLGIYRTRIDGFLNSNGKYILYLDSDDLILNPNLFQDLFNYFLKYNLDIIEFTVYHQNEITKEIFFPKDHLLNHYHKFKNKIINQPELSNILFYKPRTKIYSMVICRTIWNKIVKTQVLKKTFNFIGEEYYKEYLILAEDTIMNIINFQFASNYSNLNLPGYMYNLRKISISRGDKGINHEKLQSLNIFYYFKIFYRYIKVFNKNRNYLFYDMKEFINYLLNFKIYNNTKIKDNINKFLFEIIKDKYSSKIFKNYILQLLINLN